MVDVMTDLLSEATSRYAVKSTDEQVLYRFPNDRGASVIRHPYSYGGDQGLFELAVAVWVEDDWHFDYGTEITEDVVGYLSAHDVEGLLLQIRKMPPV